MSTRGILFGIGGLTITVGGLFTALGLIFGFVVSLRMALQRKIRSAAVERVTLNMLIFGAIISRLYFLIVNFGFYRSYPSAIFRVWEGGWSVMGALCGALIGIRRATGARGFRRALDTFVPGILCTIAIWRFAELFTWSGRGMIVGADGYAFPFPIKNEQGMNCEPVCLYECAVALALLAYSLLVRPMHSGETGFTCIMVLCLMQVPLESMRTDDYISLSFVRMDQLLAMIIAETIIVMYILAFKKNTGESAVAYALLGLTIAMIALCVVAEFRIDRAGQVALHHLIELVYVGIMAMCGIIARNNAAPEIDDNRRQSSQRARINTAAPRQAAVRSNTTYQRREYTNGYRRY